MRHASLGRRLLSLPGQIVRVVLIQLTTPILLLWNQLQDQLLNQLMNRPPTTLLLQMLAVVAMIRLWEAIALWALQVGSNRVSIYPGFKLYFAVYTNLLRRGS
jgi:hypothetical protein